MIQRFFYWIIFLGERKEAFTFHINILMQNVDSLISLATR